MNLPEIIACKLSRGVYQFLPLRGNSKPALLSAENIDSIPAIFDEKNMSDDQSKKRVLNVSEAARYSGYSRAIIEYWIDNGQLSYEEVPTPGQKNRCRRVRRADLDQFLEMYLKKNGASGNPADREKRETLILLDR